MSGTINKPTIGPTTTGPTTTTKGTTGPAKTTVSDGLGKATLLKGPMGQVGAKLEKGGIALPDRVADPEDGARAQALAGVASKLTNEDESGKKFVDLTISSLTATPFRGLDDVATGAAEAGAAATGALLAGDDFETRHSNERNLSEMKRQLEHQTAAQGAERVALNDKVVSEMNAGAFSKYVTAESVAKAQSAFRTDASEDNQPHNFHKLVAFVGLMQGGGPEAVNRINYKLLDMVKNANLASGLLNSSQGANGLQRGIASLQNTVGGGTFNGSNIGGSKIGGGPVSE